MIDKLLKKYKSSHKLNDLQEKIKNRYIKNHLQFNNKISIAFKNVSYLINDVLNNDDYNIECEFCQNKFYIDDLAEIKGYKLCEDCIANNYSICSACGDYVYNDDIHILYECECFCKKCYFIEKQKRYNDYILENKLLIDLSKDLYPITWDKIKNIYFKIDGNLWSIENHYSHFRLGSWSANCWIDIGNNINSVLNAIEINLGCNINKLEYITKE